DYFPGQAQVVARLDDRVTLPGSIPQLGWMALQQDWFTTYTGGLGFYSDSRGVDEAIERGGFLIDKLQAAGVDPDIELVLAAGRNPIMPLEYAALFLSEEERETYGTTMELDWARLKAQWLDPEMPWNAAWGDDVAKVFDGLSVVAEVSGPSDGIILTTSATDTTGLTQRGAQVVEVRIFDALNHLELTFAGRLASFFFGDETSGELFDPIASAKYDEPDNQLVEWLDGVLFTVVEQPDDDVGSDTADAGGMDTDDGTDPDVASDGGGGDADMADAAQNDTAPSPSEEVGGDGTTAPPDVPSSGDGTGAGGADDNDGSNAAPRERSGCTLAAAAAVLPVNTGGWWVVLAGVVLVVGRRRRRERRGFALR
ncbi:MAG: hypothetical protein AAFS10_14645, partial [Myxococcota bacterium]